MCIAVAIPADVAAPGRDVLEQCWDRHPNGGGFMYINSEGKLEIYKSMNKKQFVDALIDARYKNFKSPFVYHNRKATHGQVNLNNAHPFVVKEGQVGVAHNGHIAHCDTSRMAAKSDTLTFVEKILQPMPKDMLYNPAVILMLDQYIKHSKLVFLDVDEGIKIVNEKAGKFDKDGIWYSNDSYKVNKVRSYLRQDKKDDTEPVCAECNKDLYTNSPTVLHNDDLSHIVQLHLCWTCMDKHRDDLALEKPTGFDAQHCIVCNMRSHRDVYGFNLDRMEFGLICQNCMGQTIIKGKVRTWSTAEDMQDALGKLSSVMWEDIKKEGY